MADNIPVDIEFLFKSLNVEKETEKVKKEIIDVGVTTDKVTEQVEANFNEAFTKASAAATKIKPAFSAAAAGATQFAKGNYQLSYSMQQVARELPVLAISPQMFIMAISNNLPILQDNIKKVRLENEALKASGQSVTPVWKQLASSLFSWQTALIAGITIMTVYGKEIFAFARNLFSLRSELALTREELKKLNEDFAKNAGSELGKMQYLFDTLTSASEGTEKYYKAKKTIIDQYGTYLAGLDDEITTLKNVEGAYIAIKNAVMDAAKEKALSKITEEQFIKFKEVYNEQLIELQKIFTKDFGGVGELVGQKYYERIVSEIESAKGLSEEMKLIINSFDKELPDPFQVKITPQEATRYINVNPVRDALTKITEAQDKFNAKVKEARNIFDTTYSAGSNTAVESLKTIQTQIEETQSSITEAESKLKELRLPGSTATPEDIKNQEKAVKTLQEKLETLTGIRKTEIEKQIKTEAERLKAIQELADQELRIKQNLEQSKADAIKNGFARQRREAKIAYDQELADIEKQKRDYLEKLNASKGLKITDSGYINTLPDDVQDNLNQQKDNAGAAYKAKIRQSVRDAANEIKAIEAEASSYFRTTLENDIIAIDKKYDRLIERAKEAGKTNFDDINYARDKEKEDAAFDYKTKIAYQEIELEQEVAYRINAIQAEGFASELYMMNKNFNNYKKYQQQKIDLLNSTGKKEDKDQANILSAELDAESLNFYLAALKKLGEQFYEITVTINEALVEAGYLSEDGASQLNKWSEALSKGKLSQFAISEGISAIIRAFPETAAAKYAQQVEAINKALKEQQRLIQQSQREGEQEARRREEIRILEEKLAADEAALARAIKAKDDAWGWGEAYEKKKKAVNDLTEAVEEDKRAIQEAEQALNDFLSGGVTQNTIADIIAEGFRAGKTSIDDFAGYMNDVLTDAVLQIFKAEILGPDIDQLSAFITEALSDRDLTTDEKEEIDRQAKAIADANKPLWDALTGSLNFETDSTGGYTELQGISRSITEETGSLLVGQFMAIRTDMKSILAAVAQDDEIVQQRLAYLKAIATNTSYNKELLVIRDELKTMNKTLESRL